MCQTAADVVEHCSNTDISLVRLLYVGNDGVTRGQTITVSELSEAFETGVSLPTSVQSLAPPDDRVVGGAFDTVGEVRLVPQPRTFRKLPYESETAAMLCSIRTLEGEPWTADPRLALQSYLSDLDDRGYEVVTAFESEFHLMVETENGYRPHDDCGVYATNSARDASDVIRDIIASLEAQSIPVKKYYPEHGAGKHEVVTGHAAGTAAVDDHVFHTETVQAVANAHGLLATFLPKPVLGATNGLHLHLSLWDDGNAFHDESAPGSYPLSREAKQFIGGVLAHADALTALTAPAVNSYARLAPRQESCAYACWGRDNREAMVRVPSTRSGDESGATRLEFRAADAAANPYLALLGLLAAGIDGIERGIDPGEPVQTGPDALSDAEREQRGVERLPKTLGEAVRALEADETLRAALGEELAVSYLESRRAAWNAFTETAGEWNRDILRQLL